MESSPCHSSCGNPKVTRSASLKTLTLQPCRVSHGKRKIGSMAKEAWATYCTVLCSGPRVGRCVMHTQLIIRDQKDPRLLPRHSTMHLLGPSFLLLGKDCGLGLGSGSLWELEEEESSGAKKYLAFSDSSQWKFEHPHTLYTWDGACVWIPCDYKIPGSRQMLENLTLYHNYHYDETRKDFSGTILYDTAKAGKTLPHRERVQFLGDKKSNCTIHIHPVSVNDSGCLGLRVTTKNDKWMEKIDLNVSETPLSPHIQLPPEIQESQEVTLTCSLNFSCPGYQIQLKWSLEEPAVTSTLLTTKIVSTQSKLTFQPQWTHHGKNLSCQLWDPRAERILSEESVGLDVKHAPESSRVEIFPSPAKEGNKVQMTCVSPANPPPTNYTWYHDKKKVLGRTSKTFQIPAVLLGHAGYYSCLAENSLGTGQVGQEAELDVQYPPKEVTAVIQNPTPIREGDNVTLSCNYNSSNPEVSRYEWNFQGSWKKLLREVLIIEKVSWDARPISCAACNQWCSWAPSVSLDVLYAPRDVRVQQISPPSDIHSGHRVLLGCNFSSSRPRDVRFFWKKNGIFLKEGRDLTFDAISPEDAGNYNCLVNNSVGQTVSEPRILQVLYAPRRLRVSIGPKDKVMEGKKAVLTCEGDANPPIFQYSWFDWKNQNLQHYDQMLRLDPVKVQHSGAYRCQAINRLGMGQSTPSTLTVYYSPETIGRRVAVGVGFCLAALLLAFWGVKLQKSWKKIRSQQGLQENSSGQSFFVRNKKVRRAPLSEDPHSLGCYNPVMEDAISYATLRFPVGDADTPITGDAGTPETEGTSPNRDDTVTYSVVQKHRVGDYENVVPESPEDEGIHYSELVRLGIGERPLAQEMVEYVTLKH
ncbi:B-cell receptor CD22 isoform X4 [Neofelis nebulosa]|uniref:B-cell receptor CD22 isoform X4 n=1 Tax=Neofelis nebulosa TaxID=61452 RepID=UPI00272BF3B0|nr:B-cell receptor CD22 isoform X4 [Neofelis nebulosa]